MTVADVQQPPAEDPAPALPDYLTDPNAVLKDKDVNWRYGRAPDYSKTRKVFEESESSPKPSMTLCSFPSPLPPYSPTPHQPNKNRTPQTRSPNSSKTWSKTGKWKRRSSRPSPTGAPSTQPPTHLPSTALHPKTPITCSTWAHTTPSSRPMTTTHPTPPTLPRRTRRSSA